MIWTPGKLRCERPRTPINKNIGLLLPPGIVFEIPAKGKKEHAPDRIGLLHLDLPSISIAGKPRMPGKSGRRRVVGSWNESSTSLTRWLDEEALLKRVDLTDDEAPLLVRLGRPERWVYTERRW